MFQVINFIDPRLLTAFKDSKKHREDLEYLMSMVEKVRKKKPQ
jgi:hypothetical protein